MLECVVNISEGARRPLIDEVASVAGRDLLDLHVDTHHNRSVLTLVGTNAPRSVATAAIERIDLRRHSGVHPRIGAVDVVPFVPIGDAVLEDAIAARDDFASWFAGTHEVPCFKFGRDRPLPEVRRQAFELLLPDNGPPVPHPTAGACAVGARGMLIAYNVWLESADIDLGSQVARKVRGEHIRALGLATGERVQVSMNLVNPAVLGPALAYDLVAEHAAIAGAELVGLLPVEVLHHIDPSRWEELDLSEERTIEHRLELRSRRLAAGQG